MPSNLKFLSRFLLATMAAILLAGCAAKKPIVTVPSAPAPVVAEPPKPPTPEEIQSQRVEALIQAARDEYQQGLDALHEGQRESARMRFDRAVEILIDSPIPVTSDQRLSDTFSDLVENIHAVELEAAQKGTPLDAEETPVDELDVIEPSISPEKIAKERELTEGILAEYDVPVVLNDRVLAWIDLYTTRMRSQFEPGLVRSGWYLEMIREIFKEEGIPQDLAYMAHVESSYKPYAYSRAKAKGIFQFIPGTARHYGLRRDWWVDERSDPEMATRAAAAYLKDLYGMFGDWYLSMAAYNAGEGKIQRAIARTGKHDFWDLAKTSQLRLETKNYVPAILATIIISKSPEKFGFNVQENPPVVYDRVTIPKPMDLRVAAKCAGTTVEEMERLNPSLYRMQTPPNYPGFELRVPPEAGPAFQIMYEALPDEGRFLVQQHIVKRGETLAAISRRYGIGVSTLAAANSLKKNSALKAGSSLSIPASMAPLTGGHPDKPGSPGPVSTASNRSKSSSGSGVRKAVHKVSRGDTLFSIAKRYGVSVDGIRTANHLGPRDTLMPGQRLVIASSPRTIPTKSAAVASVNGNAKTGKGASAIPGQSSHATAAKTRITYRVRSGDTLSRIASKHGSSIADICAWNNLRTNSTIKVGQSLVIYR